MAEGTIAIGATTLDTPIGYTHDPPKLESHERAIDGSLLTTRIVTAEDQPVSKYHFEVSGIISSKMYAIKAEAVHIGNLDYIDYLQIVEVLSGDGSTKTFYTQRRFNSKTDPVPTITVGGVSKTPTITMNSAGRGKLVFTDAPADVDNNIIIQYEPKYYVQIISFRYTGRIKDVANYLLICEESQI